MTFFRSIPSRPDHPPKFPITTPTRHPRRLPSPTALPLLVVLCLLALVSSPASALISLPPQNVEITLEDPDPTDSDPAVELRLSFSDISGEIDYTIEEAINSVSGTINNTWTIPAVAGVGSTVVAHEFLADPNTEYCYLISANYPGAGPGRSKMTCATTPAFDRISLWRAELEVTVSGSGTDHPVDARLRYGGGRQGPQMGGLTHIYTSRDHFPGNATTRYDLMVSDTGSTDAITELVLAPTEGSICIDDVRLFLNEQLAFERIFGAPECIAPTNPLRFSAMDLRSTTEWADFTATGVGPEGLPLHLPFEYPEVDRMLDAYLGHQLVEANQTYGDDFMSWASATQVTQVDTWGGRVALGIKISGYGTSATFDAAFVVRPEWICTATNSKLFLGLTVDSFNADFGLLIDIVLAMIGGLGADDVEDFLLGLLCGAWETEVGGEYVLVEFDSSSGQTACTANAHEINFFPDSVQLFAADPRPVGPGSCECGSVRLEEPCEIWENACNPGYFAQCNESYPDSPACGGCTCVPDVGLCPVPPEPDPEPTGSCECQEGSFGNVCTSGASNSCGPDASPVCVPSTSDEGSCGGCECVPNPPDDDPPSPPVPSNTCGCGNSMFANLCIAEYDDCEPGKTPVCSPNFADPYDPANPGCGGCICG